MEKESVKVDENTPMVPVGKPGPSYVFPGREPKYREKRTKELQCYICSGILASFTIAVVIAICYTFYGHNEAIGNATIVNDQPSMIDENMNFLNEFFAFFPLPDEKPTNWALMEPPVDVIKEAINEGKIALGDKELIEEVILAPALNTPTFRHQKAVSTSSRARMAGERGYIEDHATRFLAKKYQYKKNGIGRFDIGKGPSTGLTNSEKVKCEPNQIYRSYDGRCTNKKHPLWGSAFINFRRILNPDYCDGVSLPRCSKDGSKFPSARDVSLTIHRPSYYTDEQFTVMLAVWGQFLDHDITATALSQSRDGVPIECCNTNQPLHPECFPVSLAKGDPYFDDYNVTCMNFVRSIPAPTNHFGPREQYNQATAFIDGSVVYGATEEKVRALRSFKDGKLQMFITPDNRELLPMNKDLNDGCNEATENSKGRYCFDSGDARANENLHLTSMHLIFARHHNFLVEGLKAENPQWDDEKLFQEARKILGAQMQHITYNEFLSVIIGKDASEKFGILSEYNREKMDDYDENLDPSIANEFAAAAFRFAHTLLPGLMKVTKELSDTEESIALHNMLFNPFSLYNPHGLDRAINLAVNNSIEKSDPYFTTELTEKLFAHDASPVLCGLDLVSLNIQRGRDHGLPSYPVFRNHCHLPPVDNWDDFQKVVDPQSYKRIFEIYKNPDDVDVYTGGLAEYPVKGGIIGPLFTCLISDQFIRLKKGDSYWYERPHMFTTEQLQQILGTSLSSIICRNSDNVVVSQRYVMKRASPTNPMVKCNEIDTFSFAPWKENKFAKISVNQNGDKNVKVINH